MIPVAVVGAAAVSAYGAGWEGLGAVLASDQPLPGIPDEKPLANPRARKMMSRSAYLAARCLADLVSDVPWRRAGVGYFLGVGASGGSLDDVIALLDESIVDGAFSPARFGDRGLAACNPLLAFQLMNNFTLCHGAILEGIGGPNAAVFSRGAGTTAALVEAAHAIADGECEHAIAGGADSAIHPVTRAELARDGFVERGLVPAEGAALIALARDGALGVVEGRATANGAALGVVEGCAIANGATADPITDAVSRAGGSTGIDLAVLAPWGPPAGDALRGWLARELPGTAVVDISRALGDALAASAALAWVAALDLLVARRASRVLVLGAGTDGDIAATVLAGGHA